MKPRFLILLLGLLALRASADSYAIVVAETTATDPAWREVLETIKANHPKAEVVLWKTEVNESLAKLKASHPRHTCFLAKPTEVTRAFVTAVHHLCRQWDEDPYTDTAWGILTGFDAANAKMIAATKDPLIIRNTVAGTELALDRCETGATFDELVPRKAAIREAGKAPTEFQTPEADTAFLIAETLMKGDVDLFITSGHATERDWQIGFRYRNGTFTSQNGIMQANNLKGEKLLIKDTHPKAYVAVGNCLMGHIDGPDAMALAWMNSVGVRQMAGYIEPTWYGYMGWGLLDFFVEQPGRFTLAESFQANHHALVHRLATRFPGSEKEPITDGTTSTPTKIKASELAIRDKLSPMDQKGLLFDRDVVALYGDPAWECRMADGLKNWDQTLEQTEDQIVLKITPLAGDSSFEPVNTNGSQRGYRPFVAFLPLRIDPAQWTLDSGDTQAEEPPVLADDFVLLPHPGAGKKAGPLEVVWKKKP